ncbi:MAG: hypothetical protein WCW16_04850 [Candidatus Magasanikbacteria bacterium]
MKQKLTIGISIGVASLGIILSGILLYNNYSSPTCKQTETGWQCEFNSQKAVDEYEQKCRQEGGKFICYGMCLPEYTHYCDFRFDDAGKECTSSEQCKGVCDVSREYVQTNYPHRNEYESIECIGTCKGSCSKYVHRDCEWWFEINNNIIEDHTSILCD